MDILTIGLGTIGTTYSYLFNKAGHNVEHYIRKSSKKINITELNVDMLDGRNNKKGDHYTDTYKVNTHKKITMILFLLVCQQEILKVLLKL